MSIFWSATQMRQKRLDAARAMQREKEFWEQSTQKWKEDNRKDEEKSQTMAKVSWHFIYISVRHET